MTMNTMDMFAPTPSSSGESGTVVSTDERRSDDASVLKSRLSVVDKEMNALRMRLHDLQTERVQIETILSSYTDDVEVLDSFSFDDSGIDNVISTVAEGKACQIQETKSKFGGKSRSGNCLGKGKFTMSMYAKKKQKIVDPDDEFDVETSDSDSEQIYSGNIANGRRYKLGGPPSWWLQQPTNTLAKWAKLHRATRYNIRKKKKSSYFDPPKLTAPSVQNYAQKSYYTYCKS